MKNCPRYIFLTIAGVSLILAASCRLIDIGGAGWDDVEDVEKARQYPAIESSRILVRTEEVPFQTFKQEFNGVFQDFPYRGEPISEVLKTLKTQIGGTPYSVSYENPVLKIFRDDRVIAERKLPRVFYMHPINSAAILGNSPAEDRILCRTSSRATTALHYILIADGNGDILFEKVIGASQDWDILPGNSGEIIIGGARTKTVVSPRK